MQQQTYKAVFGSSAKHGLPRISLMTFPSCQHGWHGRCIECFQTPVRRKMVVCTCQCHNIIEGRGDAATSCAQRTTQETIQNTVT